MEVLLSLGMASVVFLIVSSLMVTFYTSDTRSKQLEMFERSKNDVTLLVSNSVRWATLVQIDGSNLIIDENIFSLKNGRLYKNEEAFTPEGIRITEFAVENFSGDLNFPSLQIQITQEDRNNSLRTDKFSFVTSVRKTSSLISL